MAKIQMIDPAEKEPAKRKGKPGKSLPTDRLAFPKQMEVLRGYAAASGDEQKGVTNADVAKVTRLTASTVSMNNAFLQDTGLVERAAGGLTPAPEVFEFYRSYEWGPETAAHKLAPILRRTWFFTALESKLRFREMQVHEVVQDLALAASAGKGYQSRVEVLLEYLNAAGLIQRDNSLVSLGPTARNATSSAIQHETESPLIETKAVEQRARIITSSNVSMPSSTEGTVRFNVSIQVNMAELSGWEPPRIAAFFQGIAKVLAAKSGVEEESVS